MRGFTEILAPAGSMESLKAAVAAGADAVYTGGTMFGARAYAHNFDTESMLEAIDYIHLHGRKLYMTVNTLLKEKEIEGRLYEYLLPFYRQGLDAVIVQDVGVLKFIRQNFPKLPVHASTQMTITGLEGAKLLEEAGAERVVTARELSIEEVRRIAEGTELEIESFVHGALCYCYSGQCLFSSFLGGRSGNRGQCAQPCRLKYRAEGMKNGSHLLSLKDICTLELIPELVEAGIDSFKIEGRMKKPEYVAGVTAMYRKYTDLYKSLKGADLASAAARFKVEESDLDMLRDLYNRGGFSEGYYHTRNGKQMISFERPNHAGIPAVKIEKKQGRFWCGKALTDINPRDILELPLQKGQEKAENYTCGFAAKKGEKVQLSLSGRLVLKPGTILARTRNEQLISHLQEQYTDRKIKEKLNGKFRLSTEDSATLTISCGDQEIMVKGEPGQEAKNQPMDAGRIKKQLMKTGNTEFEFDNLDVEIIGRPFVPVQSLNEIRRAGLGQIEKAITGKYRRTEPPKMVNRYETVKNKDDIALRVTAAAETQQQLEILIKEPQIARIYADSSIPGILSKDTAGGFAARAHKEGKELFLAMPYIFRMDTARLFADKWDEIEVCGFDGMLIRNYESAYFLKERAFAKTVITDYNLYQFNHYAKEFWNERGITELTAPLELDAGELAGLGVSDSEVAVYGYLPMMISAGCVKKSLGRCQKESGVTTISDRCHKEFSVKTYCTYCYNIIYNNVPLYLGDRLCEVRSLGPGAVRLSFTIENADETRQVLSLFRRAAEGKEAEFTQGEFTRGHFKRGIK